MVDESLSAARAGIRQAAFEYYTRLEKVRSIVASRWSERISLREAAYLVGIERVVEASRTRGYI